MLTDKGLKALRPGTKPYKRADDRGLYVIVRPDGALWWRFKYRWQGREKLLSLGTYPDTSLRSARDKRDAARVQLAARVDPSAARQAEKTAHADTFEAIAREWLSKLTLKETTVEQLRHRLETYVFPAIGRYPIAVLTAADLLTMLRRIEGRGTFETAHRVRSLCGRVFRYAVASGRAGRDPSGDLRGALTAATTRHFAAITDRKRIGSLLRAIDGYTGHPAVVAALKLAPLVFVRPSELRGAEWTEIDLEAAEWRIPGMRIKMGRDHIVPLSVQAAAIVQELAQVTGRGRFLFPSVRSKDRPISDNTLNAALRSLGYAKDEQTAHGFRTIASTLLHELGWDSMTIELQLAHAEKNKSKAAYNRAERLKQRQQMMQAWADHLDLLRGSTSGELGEWTSLPSGSGG